MVLVLVFMFAAALDCAGQIRVSDRFGRDLQARAIRLVDWEGYIANPAIPISLELPESWMPATIEITGTGSRLQFADRKYPRSEPAKVTETEVAGHHHRPDLPDHLARSRWVERSLHASNKRLHGGLRIQEYTDPGYRGRPGSRSPR